MITSTIEHNGKKFEIKEVTIEMWTSVMKLKDLLEEEEMYIRMIAQVTGLSRDEVLECDAYTIQKVGDSIMNVINQQSRQLFREIEHNGIKYKLVDVSKISFGQFVDIDTYLKKEESYRIANLHELAAYLYCEDGMEYGKTDFSLRIEAFKDLPVRYIDGALFFFVEFSKRVRRDYQTLFPEQVDVEDSENKNSFNAHWGWYHCISSLCEEKVWLIDNVTTLPLYQCLNHLSYLFDINQEKERLTKETNR